VIIRFLYHGSAATRNDAAGGFNLDFMEWTGQVYADCPTAAAEVYIDAPPERVWGMVSDIFLMPELSSELQEVAWLDGATGPVTDPAVGWRFTGRSAHPDLGEWDTVSTVIQCDPPYCFAWAVGDPAHPGATWRFTLNPEGQGTRLEQWYQMGPARSGLNIAIDAMPDKEAKIVFVRLREHEAAMQHNLKTIKDSAERVG
jgi:Polyketide cyclase / dehydrase and lipid transport